MSERPTIACARWSVKGVGVGRLSWTTPGVTLLSVLERRLAEPLVEPDVAQPRLAPGNQRTFIQFGPEVPRVRISDDVARVVAREKVLTDQVIETQLYGTSHFNRAIHSAILATADATSSAAMR